MTVTADASRKQDDMNHQKSDSSHNTSDSENAGSEEYHSSYGGCSICCKIIHLQQEQNRLAIYRKLIQNSRNGGLDDYAESQVYT